MRIPCFTIASIILRVKEEPFSFEPISRYKCKEFMISYPNGLSKDNIDDIFEKTHLGEHYFKRGSNIFMVDLDEKNNSVILHYIISNEYDPSTFINTCLLYTSPSPRDGLLSRMPSSA